MDTKLKSTVKLDLLSDGDDGILSLYDKDNPDKNLFNLIDDELIKLSGSKILIFKYHPSRIDDVYGEERQKAISPHPIALFGKYDPLPVEEGMSQFGMESKVQQLFQFNKSYVERVLGRVIIPGDIIKPAFQDIKFEVFEVQENSFEIYGIYHLDVHANILRDTQEVHDEPINTADDVGGTIRID